MRLRECAFSRRLDGGGKTAAVEVAPRRASARVIRPAKSHASESRLQQRINSTDEKMSEPSAVGAAGADENGGEFESLCDGEKARLRPRVDTLPETGKGCDDACPAALLPCLLAERLVMAVDMVDEEAEELFALLLLEF